MPEPVLRAVAAGSPGGAGEGTRVGGLRDVPAAAPARVDLCAHCQ